MLFQERGEEAAKWGASWGWASLSKNVVLREARQRSLNVLRIFFWCTCSRDVFIQSYGLQQLTLA